MLVQQTLNQNLWKRHLFSEGVSRRHFPHQPDSAETRGGEGQRRVEDQLCCFWGAHHVHCGGHLRSKSRIIYASQQYPRRGQRGYRHRWLVRKGWAALFPDLKYTLPLRAVHLTHQDTMSYVWDFPDFHATTFQIFESILNTHILCVLSIDSQFFLMKSGRGIMIKCVTIRRRVSGLQSGQIHPK